MIKRDRSHGRKKSYDVLMWQRKNQAKKTFKEAICLDTGERAVQLLKQNLTAANWLNAIWNETI